MNTELTDLEFIKSVSTWNSGGGIDIGLIESFNAQWLIVEWFTAEIRRFEHGTPTEKPDIIFAVGWSGYSLIYFRRHSFAQQIALFGYRV